MMASINLVMVAQSKIFNRDFVIDHKVSMELRSSEFLDQSNTYNLYFLNIAFTFRKCPSRICKGFYFNYADAVVWMRHTLNWLKSVPQWFSKWSISTPRGQLDHPRGR